MACLHDLCWIILLVPVVGGTPWEPYCPWAEPGIDKALYSCSNLQDNTSRHVPGSAVRSKTVVKVGILLPVIPSPCTYIDITNQGIAAEIAVEDINQDPDLIPDYHLELVSDTEYRSCGREFDTLGYAYRMRVNQGVDVLIGPACADSSGSSVASFAAAENMPVISIASFQGQLNDVGRYPTFTRLYESAEIQAYYHAGIYDYFGWREIVAVIQPEERPQCTIKWTILPTLLTNMGFGLRKYDMSTLTSSRIADILRERRIISLFANPYNVVQNVLRFHRTCLAHSWCTWSDYRIIAVNFQVGFVVSNEQIVPWKCDQSYRMSGGAPRRACECCPEADKAEEEAARRAFTSVIYVVSNVEPFSEQDPLFCKVMRKAMKNPGQKPECIEQVYLVQHVYDTILIYSNALDRVGDPSNGTKITEEIKQLTTIVGMSGRIITNPKGSRYTEMMAYFLLSEGDTEMTAVLTLSPNRTTGRYSGILNEGVSKPRFVPDLRCQWHDMSCSTTVPGLIAGAVLIMVVIVSVTGLKIWLHRRTVLQTFIISSDNLEKMVLSSSEGDTTSSKFFLKTDLTISLADRQTVALLRELNQVHHSNIVSLLHCCLETSPGATLVLEDCEKGPLQHLIRTEQRVRTISFIRSFATDILRGLSYLHGSEIRYHGCLTSVNCAVDDNWNVKLQGFYLRHLAECEVHTNPDIRLQPLNQTKDVYNKLWMSPEWLRGEVTNVPGFRDNDIYSFGVVLSELIKGSPAYGIFYEENIDVKVILDQIEAIQKGEKPLQDDTLQLDDLEMTEVDAGGGSRGSSLSARSSQSDIDSSTISETESITSSYMGTDEDDLGLVKEICCLCTRTDPAQRPSIDEILDKLESDSQKYQGTLVDQWLVTLEKKSRELKALFDLKNVDLLKEKERAIELIHSLLPKEIAEKKIAGVSVAPQTFSNCSFFYSDIKGFTSIVADLTNLEGGGPMDVVEMLDNLYTIMDKAIDKYNVVKIETIGDAYVVVSGLPVPDINGSVHAANVASFALEVLSTTKDITVHKLNHRQVDMRIGVHSGSCVAGVAGNHMFHYCIYGKQPRYANNLESSGQANKIHMSDYMRKILEKEFNQKFSFSERTPTVKIPGWSKKRTWWLTGEAGVVRPMPDDPIYRNLVFKRRVSATANPRLLKGNAKLLWDDFKTDTSEKSDKHANARVRAESFAHLTHLKTGKNKASRKIKDV